MNWLLVVAGAAVGAPLRYFADLAAKGRFGPGFPWGTLAVNVSGSLVLGLVTGLASANAQLLLGTGLCGALTTYSTFSYETLKLYEDGAKGRAVLYVLVSLAAGLGAAWLGVAAAA
ncbi:MULTISPECIES: fluoride efflux transporter CrcB [unclassified Streptomyces]|uniref:fluoride efflux transporter CrcB n=1 Tax=unclassified Streptomyces TaxID=2593676 RepID=UPI00332D9F60